jgi:hypothetical protein
MTASMVWCEMSDEVQVTVPFKLQESSEDKNTETLQESLRTAKSQCRSA